MTLIGSLLDDGNAGFNFENSCVAATTANLTATYNNGASGVGATLTNSGALAAFSVDGQTPSVGARILVKDQSTQTQNGIYVVTVAGSGSVAWVLTRADDYDTPSQINSGDIVPVSSGTQNAGSLWRQTATVTTVGSSNITFAGFFLPSNYVAKAGDTMTGNLQFGTDLGIRASGSGGFVLEDSSGNDVVTVGAGGATLTFNQLVTLGILRVNSSGGVSSGRALNNQTGTTYTFLSTDIENLVVANNSSDQTYLFPARASSGFPIGSRFSIFNAGLGTVTITKVAGSTDVIDGNFTLAPGAYAEIWTRTNGYLIEMGTAFPTYGASIIIPTFVNAYGSLVYKAQSGLNFPLTLQSITVKARAAPTPETYSVQVNAVTPTGMSGIVPTTSEVTTFFPAGTTLSSGQNVTILPAGSPSVSDVEVSITYTMRT